MICRCRSENAARMVPLGCAVLAVGEENWRFASIYRGKWTERWEGGQLVFLNAGVYIHNEGVVLPF